MLRAAVEQARRRLAVSGEVGAAAPAERRRSERAERANALLLLPLLRATQCNAIFCARG